MNFTTYQAVVVVYVDCSLKGKEIEIRYTNDASEQFKATVIERSINGTSLCAAVFTSIPMLNDSDGIRKERNVIVRCETPRSKSFWGQIRKAYARDASTVEEFYHPSKYVDNPKNQEKDGLYHWEKIKLYSGNVTEVDWRGVDFS